MDALIAHGCAGDIGHIRVGDQEEPCRCGNSGGPEAVAGGAALAARLAGLGVEAASGSDVVRLVKSGNRDAVRTVREAGRAVGEVRASLVNFFNPDTVVGGAPATVHNQLLAGVREAVYRRSHPPATHVLRIEPSRTGEDAAALGAGILAIEHALSPAQVDRQPRGRLRRPSVHPEGPTGCRDAPQPASASVTHTFIGPCH
ncbi:ROK family protein [Streptomyces sp. NPDC019443]|uniref:ROK family protein n=1 Tax=Streptomyces sp. NPDC019443 TaxID=3365061 RepID=UPI00379F60A8